MIHEMGYYQTAESVQEYIRMAEGFDGRELIERMMPLLKKESVILEIGSGPGTDWEIMSETHQVTGSDSSLAFLRHLRKKYPHGVFLHLDAVTLKTQKPFDAIYSNKVLHHLDDHDQKKSIAAQAKLLNNNGLICHSFWKGEGQEVFKDMLVNYHLDEELTSMYEHFFEILVLEPYKEFEEGDSLILIGRKR